MPPEINLAWQAECLLGEGPIWLPHELALRFVDIKAGRIHRYSPANGASETLNVGGKPSFILPAADGGLVIGSENGLYPLVNGEYGPPLCTIDQPKHNRTNDGTVDSIGRLWFGTMDDREQAASGALYCFDRGTLHRMGAEAIVTNGPAITHDARTLYHVDSAARTIWRYAIEDGPSIGKGEVFIQLNEDEGYPDGVVLDSEDCLWVALWDGWAVRRYSPSGALMLHIPMPCARVTKIALGGEYLSTAYVTTARVGLSDAECIDQPLAGSLFAFDAPCTGLAPSSFKID